MIIIKKNKLSYNLLHPLNIFILRSLSFHFNNNLFGNVIIEDDEPADDTHALMAFHHYEFRDSFNINKRENHENMFDDNINSIYRKNNEITVKNESWVSEEFSSSDKVPHDNHLIIAWLNLTLRLKSSMKRQTNIILNKLCGESKAHF